jgi:Icc-related predicted phosphoesterase
MSHLRRIVAIGEIRGAVETLEGVLADIEQADGDTGDEDTAVAVVGDLGVAWSKATRIARSSRALGATRLPTFWVPGPIDAPVRKYLSEAHAIEVASPTLHGVHGTFGYGPGYFTFAGMGGQIVDDPHTIRIEEATLKYPGWEAEYRLKVLRELQQDEHPTVLLFWTPPAHKGLQTAGNEVLAQLVSTYRARVVVTAGERPVHEWLGTSLVVCPGRLDEGNYAVIDVRGSPTVNERRVGAEAPV